MGLLTLILEGGKIVDILINDNVEIIRLVVLRHIGDLERLRHVGLFRCRGMEMDWGSLGKDGGETNESTREERKTGQAPRARLSCEDTELGPFVLVPLRWSTSQTTAVLWSL